MEHLNKLFSESFSNTKVDHNVGGGIQNLKQNEFRVMNDVNKLDFSVLQHFKCCKVLQMQL